MHGWIDLKIIWVLRMMFKKKVFIRNNFNPLNDWDYWEWHGVFNPYIVIDNHAYDGNHINGIIDQTEK